jgi:hypothetical protein
MVIEAPQIVMAATRASNQGAGQVIAQVEERV